MIFFKKQHPQKRYIYAVTAGFYLGELLVYMETVNTDYRFLSLPTMIIRDIPIEKFKNGLKEKIVDVVEKIPNRVFKVCKLQYIKNTVQIAV
jgi:hypothetical protein